MDNVINQYWQKRLDSCCSALQKNNFDAFIAADLGSARRFILEEIMPPLEINSVSWGDSTSMLATGILDDIEKMPGITLIKTFESGVPREEIIERRRQALLVDLFFSGSNAVTECGKLVNLDMIGNRVGGITFGPKHVILVIGRNKIVADVDAAMTRIKKYAAPMNAIRHPGWKTPCVATSYCSDCKSPQRICNSWTITEKAYPKGRIKVVLVNEDLGL